MTTRVLVRRRRSRREQLAAVSRFQSSGLSAADFCRQQKIAYSSLQRWRSVATAQSAAARFVDLVPPPVAEAAQPRWSVEVVLPNGTCLRFRE